MKKILAVLICISMLVSCIPLFAFATNGEYTVMPGAGTTSSNCVAYLIDNSDILSHTSADVDTIYVSNKGAGDYYTPFFFGWRNQETPHASKVIYTTANSDENTATLYAGSGANFNVYGDSEFTNINLYVQNPNMGICTSGHSVEIDGTTTLKYDGYYGYEKIFVGGRANNGSIVGTSDATITLDGFSANGGHSGVIIGAFAVTDTIPGNQTLISKNNIINLSFSGNNKTVFSKNVNVVLEDATVSSVMSKWTIDGNQTGETQIEGALQILANGNSSIDIQNVYNAATANNISVTEGVYLLDSSNQNGSLEITPSAGVYRVISDYPAVATNGTDTYVSTGGYLSVPAGCYSVTYGSYVEPEPTTYTIAPGTSDSVGSSVAALVEHVIQPNHNASDKVTVYVSNIGSGENYTPRLFSWRNSNTPYAPTVTFTTAPGEERATLYTGQNDAQFALYGDSIFKNIILDIQNLDFGITTGGHSLTLDSSVKILNNELYTTYGKIFIGCLANNGTDFSTDKGTVLLDGIDFDGYNEVQQIPSGAVIFGGYNFPFSVPTEQNLISKNNKIRLAFAGSCNATFERNINIVLENTEASAIPKWGVNGATTVNGAIQILANGNSKINKSEIYQAATDDSISVADGVYLLDSSNQTGSLKLTGVVGKYQVVAKENEVAVATDGRNTYISIDGYLTVPAGAYSVRYTNIYDIVINGDLDGDGRVSVSDLIELRKTLLLEKILFSGDLNGDAEVDILDLIRLKRYLSGADVILEDSRVDRAMYALSNTYYALTQEKKLTIGYLGGSITYGISASQDMVDDSQNIIEGDIMLSWANRTTSWFESNFPNATIEHVNAGISDTATNFGLYRLENDLMNTSGHDMPDLVFVEFTSNDWIYENMPEGSQTHADVERQIESLVQNIYSKNPYADIVFVFSAREFNAASREDYVKVANHYGLQYIDMGMPLQELMTARGASQESAGSYYYTVDNLHPSSIGYGIYFEEIRKVLDKKLKGDINYIVQKTDRLSNISGTLNSTLWTNTTVISASELNITGTNYSMVGGCSSNIFGTSRNTSKNTYITQNSVNITGSDVKVSFTFTGTTFSTIFYMNSNGINMDYTIDGGVKKNFRCDNDTAFSFQKYIHTQLFVIEQNLDYGTHTVELTFNKSLNQNIDVVLGGIGYAGVPINNS